MMHRLRHCRVVKLLGVIMEEGQLLALVMEYMEQATSYACSRPRYASPPAGPCTSDSCANGWWFGFSQA